mgnify:CR=1 FL=1
MPRLSVNLNKVALIRNARGENTPDLLRVARDCEHFGAEGITVHPRPDQRHIRYSDIPALKEVVTTELNVEGNPTEPFLELVLEHRPHQVTLVPDPPGALTSTGGWDTIGQQAYLRRVVRRLHEASCRVSVFIDPEPRFVQGARECGADRVELYTGHYARRYAEDPEEAVSPHRACAEQALRSGIGLNAGHDLNLDNLRYYCRAVPGLLEVSIGHALICDALYLGLRNTVQQYLRQLEC